MKRSRVWFPAGRWRAAGGLVLVGMIASAGLSGSAGAAGAPAAEITVVSGRPDTVTGGDSLVRVDVPRRSDPARVRVLLNGTDVTPSFVVDEDARALTGVVEGLRLGENRLLAVAPGARPARAELVNHPIEGPVFSGPHQQPYVCQTAGFTMPVVGGTLGAPLDENCTVESRTDYFYRTADGAAVPWPAGATDYPADLGYTTTTTGAHVPYIVRMDTEVANRAVVQTSMLHDPLADPAVAPGRRSAGWNGDVVMSLGGGCAGGWYRSGSGTGGVVDAYTLGQGFAMMSSTLNVFGNNCNDLLAAESAMITKEIFVERYGAADHTIGWGCSGGSYQGYQITDNYPGIFDGIVAACSFPDVGFATTPFISDAWLMNEYFKGTGLTWTAEQKRQASGFINDGMLGAMAGSANRIRPTSNCSVLPEPLRYHPDTNPGGARCDIYDHTVNVYGKDPATGFARRPLDNVGIQYGLGALSDGSISAEQFVDLNEHVGGFDADANLVPERTQADLDATRIAYQSGRLTNGGGGLADVPIIEYRAYMDDRADIHVRYHSFSMRDRLEKANGTSANMVSLVEDGRYGLFSFDSPTVRRALLQMHEWLNNLEDADPGEPRIEQLTAARPADLVEGCMTRDAAPSFVAERLERDPATTCEQLYPTGSFPRDVAGAGIASDIVKCELGALDRGDYDVDFTDAQWVRLEAAFPGGVCDWTKPGIEQQGLAGTWLRF